MPIPGCQRLYERGDAGYVAADDERLDRVGALVGVDDLHVREVPGYVVLEKNAVAAHDVPRLGAHLLSFAGVVHLGQGGHGACHLAPLLELGEAEAHELHVGYLGEHGGELGLDELEARYGLAELHPLFGVVQRRLVRGDGVPYRLPGHPTARRREHLVRVLERVGAFEPVSGRDANVLQMYVRLPHGALAHLAHYELRGVAGVVLPVLVLLQHKGLDLPVLDAARPDDDDVGEGGVADQAFLTVQPPLVAVPARRGLEHHGVGAVIRLGQAPGPDLFHPRHLREPPLLLLLRAADRHRPHREPRVDPEERVQAPVPARHLYRHEPSRKLAHPGTPVALYRATRYPQLGDLRNQLERKLSLLPVLVDHGYDLGVRERPHPVADRALLIRKQLVEQVIVGPERPGNVGDHWRSSLCEPPRTPTLTGPEPLRKFIKNDIINIDKFRRERGGGGFGGAGRAVIGEDDAEGSVLERDQDAGRLPVAYTPPRAGEAGVRELHHGADTRDQCRRDERLAEHGVSATAASGGEGLREGGMGAAGDEESALLRDHAPGGTEVPGDKGKIRGPFAAGKRGDRVAAQRTLRLGWEKEAGCRTGSERWPFSGRARLGA